MKNTTPLRLFVVCSIGAICFQLGANRDEASEHRGPDKIDSLREGESQQVSLYGNGGWGTICIETWKYVLGAAPLVTSDAPGDPLAYDPYGIAVSRGEFAPGSQVVEHYVKEYSTSYQVLTVDQMWASEFLITGVMDTGESIVELWKLPPVVGEWTSSAQASAFPVGQASPLTPAHTESIVGGVYIPQANRSARARPRRRAIYLGAGLGVISACLDRDKRFATLLARDTTNNLVGLYLVDITTPGAQPVWVAGASNYPEMETAVHLEPFLYPSIGRGYMVNLSLDVDSVPVAGTEVVVIWDYDNDGIPDQGETFSNDGMWAAYPEVMFDNASMGFF